jgi:hypothetical protein
MPGRERYLNRSVPLGQEDPAHEGEIMVVVPLAATGNASETSVPVSRKPESMCWVRVAAAGALATSGVLLMARKHRAGLAMAVAGTALTILDQQETVRDLWNRLPGHLENLQGVLTRAQSAVDELSAQGERLRHILQH